MSPFHLRMLENAILSAGETGGVSGALDLGGFSELHLVITVQEAGDGESPRLRVKHAIVNEESVYVDFETPVSVDLSVSGTVWVHVPAFTRWVCWFVEGAIASSATVTLDALAKG